MFSKCYLLVFTVLESWNTVLIIGCNAFGPNPFDLRSSGPLLSVPLDKRSPSSSVPMDKWSPNIWSPGQMVPPKIGPHGQLVPKIF